MSHQTGIRGNYRCKRIDFLLWEQTLFRYSSQHSVKMNFSILEVIKIIVHNINNASFFPANAALKKFFGKCRGGNVRVFKVSIVNGMCKYTKTAEA